MKTKRRNKYKYPNLIKKVNLKTRFELIDYDYIDKLSPEEREFLDKFTKEWVIDSLDRKNLANNLHNTKELKKDCDDRNNARNRCILTRAKARNNCISITDVPYEEPTPSNSQIEDLLIGIIDITNKKKS